MADNITAKANVGEGIEVLATKEFAGVHHPVSILASDNGLLIGAGNPVPVRSYGIVEVPSVATTTIGGATTAGAFSVSITNVGGASGVIGGATVAPGISIGFSPSAGNRMGSVTYDATGTTFLIVEMTDGSSSGGGS